MVGQGRVEGPACAGLVVVVSEYTARSKASNIPIRLPEASFKVWPGGPRRREGKTRRQKGGYNGRDKPDVIARLTAEQGGMCAVCGGVGSSLGDGTSGLVLDHCHSTGRPRAMLCTRCNAALGLMREDPTLCEVLRCYAEWCQQVRGE